MSYTVASYAEVKERVAAGAAWLDSKMPGWESNINLEALRLADPCRCILGQLDGALIDVMEKRRRKVFEFHKHSHANGYTMVLAYIQARWDGTFDFMRRCGFTRNGPENWAQLDRAWKAEISKRLKAAKKKRKNQ